jgi:hypothetical protein
MNLPLFAQSAAQNVPLQIPSALYGVSVVAIGGIVVLALVSGRLLKGLRDFRAGIAEEIRRELESAAATQRVDVQQPLHVTPQITYVERPDYEREQEVIDRRLNAATAARKEIHEKLDQHGQRIALLEKSERHTEQTLANIDQKLTTILQRLPRA